ncbi:MAG: hypothetical protein LBC98_03685 [Prevotellaceae bacterium]|jgi:hypothetical protein|nr:hypothetical protein [Prevotellaceae bacterium]
MNELFTILIPAEVIEEAQNHFDAITNLLSPYLKALTPSERRKMLKMGNKSLSFVEKGNDYAHHYPQLCPPYLDLNRFDAALDNARNLRVLRISAKQLSDNLDDTMMDAGSDAYKSGLTLYISAKSAAEKDISGAKEIYEDLRSRFPRLRNKKAM